ncbi:hypothetical protein BDR05DRAFT_1006256 [Suillus weaverae]|nr:hypothetical protein BDR05DRAFT_1006256 [Suillus weaverae]
MICGTNGQTEILKGYSQQWGLDAGQHHRRWNVYLNIPNEWVLGRDYSETELEVRKLLPALFKRSLTCVIDSLFSDNSDATSADELSEVVAPSLPAEEEIVPLQRRPSLPTEECAPVKRRRASQRASVKAPEKHAFEKYLPQDVHIVSLHSIHGSRSTSTLPLQPPSSKLRLAGAEEGLRTRIYQAREQVFATVKAERAPIFLTEDVLDQFTIGGHPKLSGSPSAPPSNSHLALLAMVDCWAHLHIQPFDHLDLAATPIDRQTISNLLSPLVGGASVSFGSLELYKRRFLETASFFESRFEEASSINGSETIKAISQS